LQLSLNVAKVLRSPEDESAALLSLGNTSQTWGNRKRASQSQDIPQKLASTPGAVFTVLPGVKFYQQAADFYQQAATESSHLICMGPSRN